MDTTAGRANDAPRTFNQINQMKIKLINSLNVFAWMRSLFSESIATPSRRHRKESTRYSFMKDELYQPIARSRRATRNMRNHSPMANKKNKHVKK